MLIQQVNRSSVEKVWVNITNAQGATITHGYPVFKFLSNANGTASVETNEGGLQSRASGTVTAPGGFVGLADGDISDGEVGKVKTYGYHESALIYRVVGSVTVIPGHPLGPGAAASVGLNSNGHIVGLFGPVVALDTVTATMISLGTPATNWANHVFVRAM